MTLLDTLQLIKQKERHIGIQLKDALSSRRHWKRGLDIHLLDKEEAICLWAVNSSARIKWVSIFAKEVFLHFGLTKYDSYPDQSVFLVTLTDKSQVTTSKPQYIDIRSIKRTFSGRLKGLNYVAMIEPGYYNNAYLNGENTKQVVSWHMHALVWGIEQKELASHMNRLNARYEAIMPQCKAAHQKRIVYGELGQKLWYINKSPCKEYSIGKRSKRHKKTGAVRFKTNKRDIRPGNQVKLFHLLAPLYLDQLAMAGGEGKAILNRIKTEALRQFRELNGWSERRY